MEKEQMEKNEINELLDRIMNKEGKLDEKKYNIIKKLKELGIIIETPHITIDTISNMMSKEDDFLFDLTCKILIGSKMINDNIDFKLIFDFLPKKIVDVDIDEIEEILKSKGINKDNKEFWINPTLLTAILDSIEDKNKKSFINTINKKMQFIPRKTNKINPLFLIYMLSHYESNEDIPLLFAISKLLDDEIEMNENTDEETKRKTFNDLGMMMMLMNDKSLLSNPLFIMRLMNDGELNIDPLTMMLLSGGKLDNLAQMMKMDKMSREKYNLFNENKCEHCCSDCSEESKNESNDNEFDFQNVVEKIKSLNKKEHDESEENIKKRLLITFGKYYNDFKTIFKEQCRTVMKEIYTEKNIDETTDYSEMLFNKINEVYPDFESEYQKNKNKIFNTAFDGVLKILLKIKNILSKNDIPSHKEIFEILSFFNGKGKIDCSKASGFGEMMDLRGLYDVFKQDNIIETVTNIMNGKDE